MKTIEEIRQARLVQLIEEPAYGTIQALANAIGRAHGQVSQWKNRSKRTGGGLCNIDSESARYIEEKTGKPRGWMDNEDRGGPVAVSSMGATVGQWIDTLTEDKRMRAFWIIHQMVFADQWPEPDATAAAHAAPQVPSSKPIREPAASGHR